MEMVQLDCWPFTRKQPPTALPLDHGSYPPTIIIGAQQGTLWLSALFPMGPPLSQVQGGQLPTPPAMAPSFTLPRDADKTTEGSYFASTNYGGRREEMMLS